MEVEVECKLPTLNGAEKWPESSPTWHFPDTEEAGKWVPEHFAEKSDSSKFTSYNYFSFNKLTVTHTYRYQRYLPTYLPT